MLTKLWCKSAFARLVYFENKPSIFIWIHYNNFISTILEASSLSGDGANLYSDQNNLDASMLDGFG